MYDISKVIGIVLDALDEERDMMAHCRKIRRQKGLSPDVSIWVPSLDGDTAHGLGVSCEKSDRMWNEVADICSILDIDQERLIATVKSMRRWEKHRGLYDRHLCVDKDNSNGIRLTRFLHLECNR